MEPGEQRQTSRDDAAGGFSHSRVLAMVLIAATVIAVYLCYLLMSPFLPSLAWALALAVVGYPLHSWLVRHIHGDNLAAALSVTVIAFLVIAPAILLTERLAREAVESLKTFETLFQGSPSPKRASDGSDSSIADPDETNGAEVSSEPENQRVAAGASLAPASKPWKEILKENPRFKSAIDWLDARIDIGGQIEQATQVVTARIPSLVTGSIYFLVDLLITLFTLFYFLRDRNQAMNLLRSLMPLSDQEADDIFAHIADTIYATVYGTLIVAVAQGVAGGLMFYWLGLPAPLLWGVVMTITGVIPVLGPFVVWMPATAYLALQENWSGAIVLLLWGALVLTLGGHILYVVLVGKRLHVHSLVVFFAFMGGLALFGAAGLILGPLILAATDGLLAIWRKRTAAGASVIAG